LASVFAALGVIFFGRQSGAQQRSGFPTVSPATINDELAKLGFAGIHAPTAPDGFAVMRIAPAGLMKFARAPEPQADILLIRPVMENDTYRQDRARILVAHQPAGPYPQMRSRSPAATTVVNKSGRRFELEYFDGRYSAPHLVEQGLVPADGWDRTQHTVVLRGTDVVIGADAPTRVLSREALERMITSMV
jgi:hypothetical protein